MAELQLWIFLCFQSSYLSNCCIFANRESKSQQWLRELLVELWTKFSSSFHRQNQHNWQNRKYLDYTKNVWTGQKCIEFRALLVTKKRKFETFNWTWILAWQEKWGNSENFELHWLYRHIWSRWLASPPNVAIHRVHSKNKNWPAIQDKMN